MSGLWPNSAAVGHASEGHRSGEAGNRGQLLHGHGPGEHAPGQDPHAVCHGLMLGSPNMLSTVCLTAILGMTATWSAGQPTTAAERLASFAKRTTMERSSLVRNLGVRNIGPIETGGRIVDIEVPDPRDPSTFLVAYASNGVWKTTNNGSSFAPIFDAEATMMIGDVAFDPQDPKVMWVGTGEAHASRSTCSGVGIYKSVDGGVRWTHLGLGDTHRIARIIVSPADSNVVLVAAQGPLWSRSADRGVYRSADGGRTWQKTLFVDEVTGATDVRFHPADPRIVYAATWTRERREWSFTKAGRGSGVWRSLDGGVTWTRLAGGFPSGDTVGRIGLGVSPAAPDGMYAVVDNQAVKPPADQEQPARRGSQTPPREIVGAQVFRSEDRGSTWSLRNESHLDGVFSTYGHYFADIAVSPMDPQTVYLLGVPLVKSIDGGRTWRGIGDRVVHDDHHALWIDPLHPDHLLDGNDGGLNVSWDGGVTWERIARVPATQFYFVAVDMARPYSVYGGTQDNGVWFAPSDKPAQANTWTSIGDDDGMYVQVDTRTNERYIQGAQFGEYHGVDRTTGETWEVHPVAPEGSEPDRFGFESPILMSPHNPEIVYAASQRLYRSLDQGRTFRPISPDLTTNRTTSGDTPYSTVVTVSESPMAFGLLYVGTDDGKAWVTRDGGSTWTDVSRGLVDGRYVSRIVASQHRDGVVYASQTGLRWDEWKAYLFRSEDFGHTWKSISARMADEPVNVIREDPTRPEILYAGTDLGVWVSLDTGATWHPLGGGLPHVAVHDLVVHPRDRELVIGTHGRSVFIADVRPVEGLLDETRGDGGGVGRVIDTALHMFGVDDVNPDPSWTWASQAEASQWSRRAVPREVALTFFTRVTGAVTLRIEDAGGNVVRVLEREATAGLNTVVWDCTLDRALALAADETRRENRAPGAGLATETVPAVPFRKWMTWYAAPGRYNVVVVQGSRNARTEFHVLPAPASK